ncbi:MAG: hypothetical protein ACKO34_00650 [Vampirovibrionales bacterium]
MGLAASQARVLILTARKNDIEMQQLYINQVRAQMSNSVGLLFNLSESLEPGSPRYSQLQQRIAAIQQVDKGLQLQLERLTTQYQMVTAELESVRKNVQGNIKATFKALG